MFYNWKDVKEADVIFILEKVKDFFADPSKWIYWPIAIDGTGLEVDPLSPKAIKFSLMGALTKFASEKYSLPLGNYIDCAAREFLDDLSDNLLIKGLSYEDEYALICLGHEFLTKKIEKNV